MIDTTMDSTDNERRKIMTTEEREIGKIVAEAIDLLPKLPEETQAYIKGWMAGVVAVAASSESRPAS